MSRVSEHLKGIPIGGASIQKSGGGICKEGCGEKSMGSQVKQDANSLGSKPTVIQGEQRGPVNL